MSSNGNAMPDHGNTVPGSCNVMFGVAGRHTMPNNCNAMSDVNNQVSSCGDAMSDNANTMPNFGANPMPVGDYAMSRGRHNLPNEVGNGPQRARVHGRGGGIDFAKLGFTGGVCHCELVTRDFLLDL